MAINTLSKQLAFNPQALDGVRAQNLKTNTHEGVKAAARQFETYFLQMMLRSMRETLSQDSPFDSQETRTFTEMFDQQISQMVSQSKGVGLADMLIAQIERNMPKSAGQASPATRPVNDARSAAETSSSAVSQVQEEAPRKGSPVASSDFIQQIWPYAAETAKKLGVPVQSVLAQAALESGWGKKTLKTNAGAESFNLFNIKAGSDWKGAVVAKEVVEYKSGVATSSVEKFRVYHSYRESFADYAKLLSANPRYANALNQDAQGFAAGLQQGGFATDPGYAGKIMRVFNSASLRQLPSADGVDSIG